MRIKGIDHIQLAVPPSREAEARAFYEGLLGLPEVPKPQNVAKRGECWFVRGALKLHSGVEDLSAFKTVIASAEKPSRTMSHWMAMNGSTGTIRSETESS